MTSTDRIHRKVTLLASFIDGLYAGRLPTDADLDYAAGLVRFILRELERTTPDANATARSQTDGASTRLPR